VQWVADKAWVYRVVFAAPAAQDSSNLITDLVFEGLDTYATVTLNGSKVLEASNMHLQHRVNIDGIVQLGEDNVLEILFDSALLRGRELVGKHPEHQHFARQTEQSRIPVRKAQYNWGWDWGPILMTAGPWRPVRLEQYSCMVDDIWSLYDVASDFKSCSGRFLARIAGAFEGAEVDFCLALDGLTVFKGSSSVDSTGMAEVKFAVQEFNLWNPMGYGLQIRYQLSATVRRERAKLDSQSKTIGFRRCELIQEVDDHGKSFYFRINGVDIFAGGSCWIPADSFLTNVSAERYHSWIKLLAESNQIMIRVWGGGVYEGDAFLEACDELGILVWHDFAFVCGNYPTYPTFLDSVTEEVRQNVRRLRSHPSLVLWAGNNEDYQVMERYKLEYKSEDHDPESWLRSSFPARYIYEHLLPKLVEEEAPGTIYHPGSPWGDGKHTNDPTVGDIHQWNSKSHVKIDPQPNACSLNGTVWHGDMTKWQECSTLAGRFVSEFGMEAYPHMDTTQRMIRQAKQQRPGSMMMDFRNKAGDHERRLMTYVAENFAVKYDLSSFTHLTQIVQSETMRYAYKTWRRMWGKPGNRQCGGVLVWQINDCWPTISWAVVDYYMVKKPAYYAIARAMQPLDIGVARETPDWTIGHNDPALSTVTCFDVWIASTLLEDIDTELEVSFISIKTGKPIREAIKRVVTAQPNATTEVIAKQHVTKDEHKLLDLEDNDPYVVHASLSVDGHILAKDTAWPSPLKYIDFSYRHVTVEYSHTRQEAKVSAKLPVKGFVFSEKQGIELSDNGFDIVPGEEHVVRASGLRVGEPQLEWTYIGAPGTCTAVVKSSL